MNVKLNIYENFFIREAMQKVIKDQAEPEDRKATAAQIIQKLYDVVSEDIRKSAGNIEIDREEIPPACDMTKEQEEAFLKFIFED